MIIKLNAMFTFIESHVLFYEKKKVTYIYSEMFLQVSIKTSNRIMSFALFFVKLHETVTMQKCLYHNNSFRTFD